MKKKTNSLQRILLLVIVLVNLSLVVAVVFLMNYVQDLLNSDIKINLTEIVTQNRDTVSSRLKLEINNLDNTASKIENSFRGVSAVTDDMLRLALSEFGNEGGENTVCIANAQGQAYLSDGRELDIAGRNYFRLAMAGTANISDKTVSRLDGSDNLRTFYANKALFSYEVTPKSVRFTAVAYPDNVSGIQLMVNDAFLELDAQPKIVSGRTLVPVRGIFEELGAKVQWDQATQTATMTKDGTEVRVTIGSKTAYVGGEAKTLDVPAQLSQATGNARTLVPVRFISESLGALVGWSNDTQTVIISAR